MRLEKIPSPNFNERKDGKKPTHIVLHYTETRDREHSLEFLLGTSGKEVSSHYLIDTDGTVLLLVEEEMRAWHAGKGYWQGETDLNSTSIGIEIQNTGSEPFPQEQIDIVVTLCKEIMQRHNIPAQNVIAHSDLAPDRKKDPGELFPWKELAQHGVGIWPEINDEDIDIAKTLLEEEEALKNMLQQIGYAPVGTFSAEVPVTPTLAQIITAFQRHWEPEAFLTEDESAVGKASTHTIALILAVLRYSQKNTA